MKRFITASVCTLVLSLLGAFGANQNSVSYGRVLNANSNTTSVVENVTNTANEQNLPSDNQTKVAAIATEATNTNIIKGNESTANQSGMIQVATKRTIVKKNCSKNTAKKAVKSSCVTNNCYNGNNNCNNNGNNSCMNNANSGCNNNGNNNCGSNGNNSCNANNGKVIVYKNVNLSQCDSVNDVIKELQKNGYSNIDINNIQNNKSLKDILATIKGNCSSNTCTKPAPTTAPVQNAKPTPTVKPAPTQAPVPTTKPAPTTAPAPTVKPSNSNNNSGISSYAQEVLRLVNIEREKAGLTPYTTNSTLTAAANKRAQETVQSFSHTRPNGTAFQTVLAEYGISYRAAGENIAYGQKTPQEVVTGWMNSPGHRANILNANFNKIGIGVYQSNGVIYWTQEFTN